MDKMKDIENNGDKEIKKAVGKMKAKGAQKKKEISDTM